jgi:hypothetical protein
MGAVLLDDAFYAKPTDGHRRPLSGAVDTWLREAVPGFTFARPRRTFVGCMDSTIASQLTPGTAVRITQQIAARHYTWTTDVVGTVVDFSQKTTGSWYAHSKDDKLWLDRLTLRKTDGELTTLILDEFSHVEIVACAPDTDAAALTPPAVTR